MSAPLRKSGDLSELKVQGDGNECAIFQLDGEDHTLGNSLRFVICRDPDVKFCGYSMPHPNDRRVLLQIQVYPGRGKTALDVLENGLKQLIDVTSHVKNVFEEECCDGQ